MLKQTLLLILILSLSSLQAQTPKRIDQYGQGYFHWGPDFQREIPVEEGVALFSGPNTDDEVVGMLYGNVLRSIYGIKLFSGETDTLEHENLVEINPIEDLGMLKFDLEQNGFYRIAQQRFWIRGEEMKAKGLIALDWITVFLEYPMGQGMNVLADPCLNLRETPALDGKKVHCLTNQYDLIPTGERQGDWIEVKAIHYKHRCLERMKEAETMPKDAKQVILDEHKGWIKAIDNAGAPYIWSYICGC